MCDGELILLGKLGGISHYRCRACGIHTHSMKRSRKRKDVLEHQKRRTSR